MSKAFIAALQISLDGFVQGADAEVDWIDAWNEALDLIPGADAAVVGGGTYPGYEHLWETIAAEPQGGAAMLGRVPTEGEVEYARWTQRTPHYVLSTTLDKVNWEVSRLVRRVGELRLLKEQSGGPVYVVGGAAIVSSLINERLIDELRLIVHPVILGGGTALFTGVKDRQTLRLVESGTGRSGRIVLSYRF